MIPAHRVIASGEGDEAAIFRIGVWLENRTFARPDGCIITLAVFAGARS